MFFYIKFAKMVENRVNQSIVFFCFFLFTGRDGFLFIFDFRGFFWLHRMTLIVVVASFISARHMLASLVRREP